MQKILLISILVLASSTCYAQFTCPTIESPVNGAIDVPVDTEITWNTVEDVPSYLISIGTAPNGTDIVDSRSVGSPAFTPPLGLPENTEIYVTITLFFFNADNIVCASEQFRTEDVTEPPGCTGLTTPENGAAEVGIDTDIIWDYAPKATGYLLSIGSTPGGTDVEDELVITGITSYEPPDDLPFDTELFVSIIPFNENGPAENCEDFSFITEPEVFPPECTALSNPPDGAVNVPLTPLLEWDTVPNASGYRLFIGTSPIENSILDGGVYSTNSTEVIDVLPARTIYVTVVPFNAAGDAMGCAQSSFTTILGCGPLTDEATGEIISFGPEIDFPDQVALCSGATPTIVSSNDIADGYRWFKINGDGSETVLSETADLSLTQPGNYRYEAYNNVFQTGITVECANSKTFNTTVSETATIVSLDVSDSNNQRRIAVQVTGSGDYEYALNQSDGTYQDSPIFGNLPIGQYTIFVRDKNGCGIAEENTLPDVTQDNFPRFFTPNGDGVNDFWQYVLPPGNEGAGIETIAIFDRYGNLLAIIEPESQGWDGTMDGRELPSSDYWFKAIALNREEIKGHFTLKR